MINNHKNNPLDIILRENHIFIEKINEIPEKFQATRYHSLVIDKNTIKNHLKVNAWLENGTVMGIEHLKYSLYGVQFHPESIETNFGKKIIENFINIV